MYSVACGHCRPLLARLKLVRCLLGGDTHSTFEEQRLGFARKGLATRSDRIGERTHDLLLFEVGESKGCESSIGHPLHEAKALAVD